MIKSHLQFTYHFQAQTKFQFKVTELVLESIYNSEYDLQVKAKFLSSSRKPTASITHIVCLLVGSRKCLHKLENPLKMV